MADLEAVLADVSYLMAMEKSKSTPAARASKKIILPDPSVRSVMHKYLEKNNEVSFDKIFNQKLGYLLFKEYCETLHHEPVPQLYFYEEIKKYERLETEQEREQKAREIYDNYIMGEELGRTDTYPPEAVQHVWKHLKKKEVPTSLFQPYMKTIFVILENVYKDFVQSAKYTRFCQWKNLELNIQLTLNDFSFHRIIGRGGFGEVFGSRKADTGKMYAMKCLDKKRIKMKQGEMLALNERIMLSLVSTGDDCPFIVNMTYAFQTPEKLYFVLDLMNGGDLHYHLTQHGRFHEHEMRFYAAEVILGLEHMHSRHVVYRDLKPANILLDENGHVRISDLGLACDFSKKLPNASVGTHGYMAPEVLSKNQTYDSSADWFSLGCMLYKLIMGHSPFRHHKTRDKHEIDRMTLTQSVELPDSFSLELRSLLVGLLQRDVGKRLGCKGRGAQELKSHPFFRGIDWRVVYLQRLAPPLIPARGEVNAADAFDIGSFDDEDTKHIKLTAPDQELYRNFPVVVSQRWQHEIAETIFDYINHEADKAEMKRKSKLKALAFQEDEKQSDCILHGYIKRLGGTFTATWLTRYVRLYPNRLELYSDSGKQPELIFMDQIEEICNDYVQIKNEQCIVIKLYNHSKYVFTNSDEIGLKEWHVSLKAAYKESLDMLTTMAEKATKIYGTEIPLKHMGKRRQQLQLEATSSANFEQKIIQRELQASSERRVAQSATSGTEDDPNNAEPLKEHSSSRKSAQHRRHHSKTRQPHHRHKHPHNHRHGEHRHAASPLEPTLIESTVSSRSGSTRSTRHTHRHKQPSTNAPSAVAAASVAPIEISADSAAFKDPNDASMPPAKADKGETSSATIDKSTPTTPEAAAARRHASIDDSNASVSLQVKVASPAVVAPTEEEQVAAVVGMARDKRTVAQDDESATTDITTSSVPVVSVKEEAQAGVAKGEQAAKQVSADDKLKARDNAAAPCDKSPPSSRSSFSSSASSRGEPEMDSSSESVTEQPALGTLQAVEAVLITEPAATDATADAAALDKAQLAQTTAVAVVASTSDDRSLNWATAKQTERERVEKDAKEAASHKETSEPNEKETEEGEAAEQGKLKLALSLENVSDQQEVLRDPSKRITSDNLQREQDLVQQYEELNITNRTSSSSIED